ncbi:MAG: cysteine desulfurase [Bdellovibrionales bacterium]|jgi:cysteine desulfurase / selenocysteine lyase|nr:cysteine desulfurase [Bdellovibrionales bacterium]MBT3526579.1 cysteine desulfurase [Bdellovibrionales bacterium]MBT7670571.1 cysteine desulfurase [Bdellovibrionales bacterium]MBT7768219.1 cysteine desulfurase [Bdellovibrionales bacterium]
MLDFKKIRADFPALDQSIGNYPLIYLDNAASTLKPRPVIDALNHHYSKDTANIHRGNHTLSERGTKQYEEARIAAQKFIGAKHCHEVIFTSGTTESINLAASAFGANFLKPADEILLTYMEHHSNIVPWQLVAKQTGAIIKVLPINQKGELIMEQVDSMITAKTKIIAITHTSNVLGTINPVKEIIQLAHAKGVKVLVDAAQGVAHAPINVLDLDCDFLAFSGHKIYGPTGIGILYGKEELLDSMPPYQGGGEMIDVVTFEETTFNNLPYKFEAGTPHIAGAIALKPALDYVTQLGIDNIAQYENTLLEYATSKMEEIKGLKIVGTAAHKSAVISFNIAGAHPQDIGTLMDQQGVALRTGHHCASPLMQFFDIPGTVRASFSFYNTTAEVDILIDKLHKSLELL